jgi:predicted dinucleotide-binding enzyme
MRIGVIGAGNVGKALGVRWRKMGHEVVFGVRNPDDSKYDFLRDLGVGMVAIDAAAGNSEIVVMATPWAATENAIRACGELAGKIVVDCTNPLKPNLAGLTHSTDDSGGEQVARWAKGAKVVKAFNTVGFNIMEMPEMEGRRAVMFICGDDEGKLKVKELSDSLGFETIDAGPLESARLLEPFALLWITGAYRLGLGRGFAFSLIRSQTG